MTSNAALPEGEDLMIERTKECVDQFKADMARIEARRGNMIRNFRVTLIDFKDREWTFYVTAHAEDIGKYAKRLRENGTVKAINVSSPENTCTSVSEFSQLLIGLGIA